jgi:hypothetical protein
MLGGFSSAGASATDDVGPVSGTAVPFTCSKCASPCVTPLLMPVLPFSCGCASAWLSAGAGGGGGGGGAS